MPVTVEVPESVDGVLGALGDGAIVLAGGTHVMPRLNTGPHDVSALVSLRRAGLAGIEVERGGGEASGRDQVTIGAATTLSAVGADERLAFLRPVIESIASPTIRNLATVGGNLFVEQPYGDLAVALLALDAQLDVAGPGASEPRGVADVAGLPAGHVVTAVRFALPTGFRYTKAMRRRLNSASIVTVAAVLGPEPRLALGGAGRKPIRSASAEAVLAAGPLDRERAEAAGRAALEDAEPFTDAYASAWYRARVLPVHVRRALIGEAA
jgi:CO/xanthine dehydrogenase FAD-binding subunit